MYLKEGEFLYSDAKMQKISSRGGTFEALVAEKQAYRAGIVDAAIVVQKMNKGTNEWETTYKADSPALPEGSVLTVNQKSGRIEAFSPASSMRAQEDASEGFAPNQFVKVWQTKRDAPPPVGKTALLHLSSDGSLQVGWENVGGGGVELDKNNVKEFFNGGFLGIGAYERKRDVGGRPPKTFYDGSNVETIRGADSRLLRRNIDSLSAGEILKEGQWLARKVPDGSLVRFGLDPDGEGLLTQKKDAKGNWVTTSRQSIDVPPESLMRVNNDGALEILAKARYVPDAKVSPNVADQYVSIWKAEGNAPKEKNGIYKLEIHDNGVVHVTEANTKGENPATKLALLGSVAGKSVLKPGMEEFVSKKDYGYFERADQRFSIFERQGATGVLKDVFFRSEKGGEGDAGEDRVLMNLEPGTTKYAELSRAEYDERIGKQNYEQEVEPNRDASAKFKTMTRALPQFA
jgi:hypothetical protein